MNNNLDLNVSNYSDNDLLQILQLRDFDTFEITNNCDQLISKYQKFIE